jgi:hypothetical protein
MPVAAGAAVAPSCRERAPRDRADDDGDDGDTAESPRSRDGETRSGVRAGAGYPGPDNGTPPDRRLRNAAVVSESAPGAPAVTRGERWNAATFPNDPLRLTAVRIGADDRGTAYPRMSGADG